jgi:general secretion pathway protein I
MGKTRDGGSAGFTLVEVLVALTILSLSLAALLRIFSSNLERVSDSEKESIAVALTQSLLSAAGREHPLQIGDSFGQFPNGYRWHLHVARYGDAQDASAWPVAALMVTADTSWSPDRKPVRLTALRFVPKASP